MFAVEMPRPVLGAASAFDFVPGSLFEELSLTGLWLLPTGMFDGASVFDGGGSALPLPSLPLEKKEVDLVGIFEEFDAVDVIEALRVSPSVAFPF